MKKYTLIAIIQFITVILLGAAIALCWAAYVYEDMPLSSVICFTTIDLILLLFKAAEYVVALAYFKERDNEEDS